ncbi:hypothetical protein O998_03500 [Anaplasma phagocytophilum str. Norway variant1]|uniref:Uncharacterized protein n=1 Tax=Anaplasma phagocytophilum str. Norway variant1 TaxID=1392506 RepID=A0A7H9DZ46_ANAPH|nr:hypothetical protein [Anaplasma phagocytophilum]QLL66843.1 hypothetical protein O998_03500 [Anaplasma phagocytophilum str. Norway variant1]
MNPNNSTNALHPYIVDILNSAGDATSVEFCNSVLYSILQEEDFSGVFAALVYVLEGAELSLKTAEKRAKSGSATQVLTRNACYVMSVCVELARRDAEDEEIYFFLHAVLLYICLGHLNRDAAYTENAIDDLSDAIYQTINALHIVGALRCSPAGVGTRSNVPNVFFDLFLKLSRSSIGKVEIVLADYMFFRAVDASLDVFHYIRESAVHKIVEAQEVLMGLPLPGHIASTLLDKEINYGAMLLQTKTEQISSASLRNTPLTYRLNTLVLRLPISFGDGTDYCLPMRFMASILCIANDVKKLNPFLEEAPDISSRVSNLIATLAIDDVMPMYREEAAEALI